MQNALEDADMSPQSKGFRDFTSSGDRSRHLIRIVQGSLNLTVHKGTTGQTEPRERLTNGKGNSTKGDI
jgi:hypothetical protein